MVRITRPILSCLILLTLAGCSLFPDGRGNTGKPGNSVQRPVAATKAARQCLAGLNQAGARYTALPDAYYGAGCSTLNSVRIEQLSGDNAAFALSNLGPVTCPTAQMLANWARYGVDRAARQIMGSPLARIETMGSYACRNIAGTGKRSAHSRAEAIDVAGFILADGRRVSVLKDWRGGDTQRQRFLRVVQDSACKRFGTVLGPEYNSAHKNHFHLELGGGGFCR